MLHPSYTDLMKVVNQDVEEGERTEEAITAAPDALHGGS